METKFQSSFIPRKQAAPAGVSMSSSPHHSLSHSLGGIFMSIAAFLFVASLLAAGGAYLWRSYLYQSQTTYQAELIAREKEFNVDLIQQLDEQSVKISLAKQVLADHVAASRVFGVIGALTAEHVRFMSLDFTGPTSPGGDSKISLSGYGQSLSTVAFQSDVLGMLGQYGLRNIVKNPILSDPALNENGTVGFNLTASVDPSALSYEAGVTGATSQSSPASSSASTTP